MAEDWKLQINYKTQTGDLINIRANTGDELSVLLESLGDYATQIEATRKLIVGAGVASPLSMSTTTTNTAPPQSSIPPQASVAPATSAPPQGGAAGPTCIHGNRKYKSGISQKTGNPYAMWVCPQPQGADQCKPVN
jgi:hypothetical protein